MSKRIYSLSVEKSKRNETKPNRVRGKEPAAESLNSIEEENVNDLSDSNMHLKV